MHGRRTPGQRAGLTGAAVHAAARELLAEKGLERLTMRALANRLGVAPNTLYSYVSSKTALVDDLLDDVLAEVRPPARDVADPRDGLYRLMMSTYEVLLTHPDLVPLYLARQGARGPNAERLGDLMSAFLDRAAVRGPAAGEALRVLIVYTIGFAAFSTRPPGGLDGDRPLDAEAMERNFANGLHWLLAGIVATPARS